jgi:hypothetical protein
MSDRLEELAMRRRRLLLRSERLRAELAADQQVMLDALSGVDRAVSKVRRIARPALMVGGALLLFKLIFGRGRGRGRSALTARTAAAGSGLAMKALFWLSTAQRVLPYISLARNLWRSRSSRYGRYGQPYADAGAETEHLH